MNKGRCLRTMHGHRFDVNSVSATPDGQWALSGSSDQTLRLWNLDTGQCVLVCEGHGNPVGTVAMSSDRRWGLAATCPRAERDRPTESDLQIVCWDLSTGQRRSTLTGHASWTNDLAISPDGSYAFSASTDGTLRKWDLKTTRCLVIFRGHRASVKAVAISRSGRWLLSGSRDGTLRLWDTATGRCLTRRT